MKTTPNINKKHRIYPPVEPLSYSDLLQLLQAREREIARLQSEIAYLKEIHQKDLSSFQEKQQAYENLLEHFKNQEKDFQQTLQKLRETNEEMEMQRNYLEATVAELEKTLQKLQESNEEMEMQRNYLQETVKELDRINSNMAASINYAQRIQKAMLPSFAHLQQYLPQSFVLLKPKDVVSGDFYWYSVQGHQIILAAVDCTGHGVPGALMSIIGHSLLEKVVNVLKIFSPERILFALCLSLQTMLNQDETHNKDGMDLAVCKIDLRDKVLEYAGARSPLVMFQNGQMQVIKPNRKGIGGWSGAENCQFTKHTFSLEVPTVLYMFSDGFADQFGGSSVKTQAKRLGSANFYQMLASLQSYPVAQHGVLLEEMLHQWRMGYHQIDDILVMGLQID